MSQRIPPLSFDMLRANAQSSLGEPFVVSHFGRSDCVETLDEIGAQDRLVEP